MNYTLTAAERLALACIAEMIAEIPNLHSDDFLARGLARNKIELLNIEVKNSLELGGVKLA